MPCDMLVKLYTVQEDEALLKRLKEDGILIKRALPTDLTPVRQFALEHFSQGWADEAAVSMVNNGCFIAVKDQKIQGFACIEAMRGYFGPIGVAEAMRGLGVGRALLLRGLCAMREMGYAYAIIGWVDDALMFYKKTVNAIEIADSFPGQYQNLARFS